MTKVESKWKLDEKYGNAVGEEKNIEFVETIKSIANGTFNDPNNLHLNKFDAFRSTVMDDLRYNPRYA